MLQAYVREQKQMEETLRKDRRRFRMLKVRYVVETIFYIILGLMALGIVCGTRDIVFSLVLNIAALLFMRLRDVLFHPP